MPWLDPAEQAEKRRLSEQRQRKARERLLAARDLPYDEMIAESDRAVLEETGWA